MTPTAVLLADTPHTPFGKASFTTKLLSVPDDEPLVFAD